MERDYRNGVENEKKDVMKGMTMNETLIEQERDGYLISTDPARINVPAVHHFLASSYWAPGLPLDVLTRSIAGSLCFGIYQGERQVGFARVITDQATFAYLADVYVLEGHRGKGLAQWLLEVISAHPGLQGLRRFLLVTRDAHGLYEKAGFQPIAYPEGFMERRRPNPYLSEKSDTPKE